MANGGFAVKFDGKKVERCYAVEFNYDEWYWVINGKRKNLPKGIEKITIEVEVG